jgi:hypothetical protein
MTTVQLTTNLQGLKRNCWRKNLNGFFTIGGKPLSDSQVRKLVNWGIEHGCRTEADIPADKIAEILQEKPNDKQPKLF